MGIFLQTSLKPKRIYNVLQHQSKLADLNEEKYRIQTSLIKTLEETLE